MLVFLAGNATVHAQVSADKIVAIVGRNRIILQSDLDIQAAQIKQQEPAQYSDTVKCVLLQQMILKKMLMEQAERDSVLVSDEEVEGQLNNRLRYFIQLYGSKEKLEQASGKTLYQLKEDNREIIREDMVSEKMQGEIMQHVKITPFEVEAFYNKIPKDSLPFYPAAVEVGQIVIDPPVSAELDAYAHTKIEDIRNQIVNGGKSFETLAGIYSNDPGSRDNGGRYDDVSRTGAFAPEFLTAAFKLQNGEISPIIKTKFGYHIIQMIQRKGDEADLRHILIRGEVTSGDFKATLAKLDSVRSQLVSGTISFPLAVGKFATDEASKRTGGMIADPQTGNTLLEINKLDPTMVLSIDSLQPGQYSQPQIFYNEAHEKSCRIIYLRSRTAPHKANLKDDYSKIQDVALQQKKAQKMQQWVITKLPTYYLRIDPDYQTCSVLQQWKTDTGK
ncbi:MAG: peptidylprolyl isomerase [Flavipsychrobacter sp.]|nr:peptidylprolyl isomerase [Flavipsychrobacter sp.]